MNAVLFVFGMGRSGSSALTRVLSLCGGALPAHLLGANEGNPLGHWEPQGALAINDAFLSRHGASWFDPTLRLQGEIIVTEDDRSLFLDQITSFLRELPPAPVHVIKEPRITALSGFWFEAARQAGMSVKVVIPVRHPAEVVSSLTARDGTTPELSSALWLKYNLLAERESRNHPRVFVEYASLLRNWRAQVSRIAAGLSVSLAARDEHSVDQFLRQDLRRQRHHGETPEPLGHEWLSRTYGILAAAARDEPADSDALDDIFESYRACERGFRTALGDFRARFAIGAQGNPNITRLICAVAGRESQALRACINDNWYRTRNQDVFAAGRDPYEHWMTHGFAEGRLPCEDPLRLLDALMRERMTGPAAPALSMQGS